MRSRVKEIVYAGIFSALALTFTYIESFIPTFLFPGFRFGFANIVILLSFYVCGNITALEVSFLKVGMSFLLFGNIQQLLFSAIGTFLAYLSILISRKLLDRKASFAGISMISASFHNFGQIIAAFILYGQAGIFSYLPLLLCASVFFGAVTGIIINLIFERIGKAYAEKEI